MQEQNGNIGTFIKQLNDDELCALFDSELARPPAELNVKLVEDCIIELYEREKNRM